MNLVRLLQLASPTLPVGAYSYSQGLEAAIEAGYVKDAETAHQWIGDVLELSVARMEAQVLRAMLGEMSAARRQARNDFFVATRETAELRAETLQMGQRFREACCANMAIPVSIRGTGLSDGLCTWRCATGRSSRARPSSRISGRGSRTR